MRWADLDQLGHVNNVVYVDYLQEARVDMLRAHGRGTEALASALVEGLVVARHEVTFLKPLTYDFRPVSIECWVTDIKAATFTMAYEIFDDGDAGERVVYLRATTVLTPYVFAEERPRRITHEERAALEVHLEPDHQPRRRTPPLPEPITAHYPIHVRFSDVDVYGHVNNVKYFEYLQEARISMVNDLVPVRRFSVVVAQTDVDYVRPLLFRATPYDCRSTITRVGTRSMTVQSEFLDGDVVLARANVVVVFFDLASGRSTEPEPEVRAALLGAAHPD
ncbi:thioesterase family protein [uncultured Nocardioides sp.]|uniref:acyl-CoA thioesterase n=1 Tax=uncultured Nocardioides sp. TaxID=198441 RepID=UPI00344EE04B